MPYFTLLIDPSLTLRMTIRMTIMNYKFKKSLQSSVFSFRCPRSGLGFTLMELMVVVSLILILLGVGMTNYITQIKRSRDARRKSDLEQIRSALEMYRADHTSYPVHTGSNVWCSNTSCGGSATFETEMDIYIDLPEDPLSSPLNFGAGYIYGSNGDGSQYSLGANLEINTDDDRRAGDPECGEHGWPCGTYCCTGGTTFGWHNWSLDYVVNNP